MRYPRPLEQIEAELADLDKRVQRITDVVRVLTALKFEGAKAKNAHHHRLDGYAMAYDVCLGRLKVLRRELAQAREWGL